jgi:hypothetical protein
VCEVPWNIKNLNGRADTIRIGILYFHAAQSPKAMSRAKQVVLTLITVVALLFLADVYPALRFRGDAKFSGGPVFGCEIKMRPIPFYGPGEYVFYFRGLPDEEMSLQLYTEGKTDKNREELTHLGTTISALLVDQNGRVVCEGSGMPRDGQNERIWVVMSSGLEAAFWHWNCVQMPLKPFFHIYSYPTHYQHRSQHTQNRPSASA